MDTATRGNQAEAAVLDVFVRQGHEVLVPFGGGQPYDLVVDLGKAAMLRVQCKRAWAVGSCLTFNALSTDHGSGPRSYRGLADVFAVYFPPNDRVYVVPVEDFGPKKGSLRLEPTRNNQRRGVRYAADYEIGSWSRGALIEIVRGEESVAERCAEFA